MRCFSFFKYFLKNARKIPNASPMREKACNPSQNAKPMHSVIWALQVVVGRVIFTIRYVEAEPVERVEEIAAVLHGVGHGRLNLRVSEPHLRQTHVEILEIVTNKT